MFWAQLTVLVIVAALATLMVQLMLDAPSNARAGQAILLVLWLLLCVAMACGGMFNQIIGWP